MFLCWNFRARLAVRKTLATLEEAVAEKLAELLIEAAEARRAITMSERIREPQAGIPAEAARLESEVMKWENRLNWWRVLRRTPHRRPVAQMVPSDSNLL